MTTMPLLILLLDEDDDDAITNVVSRIVLSLRCHH